MWTVQQVFNNCFDSTNNQLNTGAATGTKIGSYSDSQRSEQQILNAAYDSNTLLTKFT